MAQHLDRPFGVGAAQVNDGAAGTLLPIQTPALGKGAAGRGLVIPRRPALPVSGHEPVTGGLEGRDTGVVKALPDLLLPQMVEALMEILRPVFPRRGKDWRDAQRQAKADDLPQPIRMGVRALKARVIVKLGIRGTTALPSAHSDGCRTLIPISVGQRSDLSRTPFRFISDSVPG